MWQTLSEPRLDKGWRFHVHAERFDIEEFAGMSDAEIASWLEGRWMEKSKRLQKLQQDLESGIDWSDDDTHDGKLNVDGR
jgi:transcriptional regulator with XRE-family HTH domain